MPTETMPTETIDAAGMTLMPGLISSHLHPDFYKFDIADGDRPGKERPPGVLMAIGVRTCRVLLESGFTGYSGASCSQRHRRSTEDGHRRGHHSGASNPGVRTPSSAPPVT